MQNSTIIVSFRSCFISLIIQYMFFEKQGTTSTQGTGPSSAYEGDYYLYMETSSGKEGDVARLLSHDFIFGKIIGLLYV